MNVLKSQCWSASQPKHHGYQASNSELQCQGQQLTRQIEDLLGMQNANLLNLPENYTFKYCASCTPAHTR
jgi:hypothetical protein